MDYSKGREGRKIVFVSDTRPCKETITNSKNADILIHEATFVEGQKENAVESFHSTAFEAGEIAKKASVKRLILFHISSRNPDAKKVLEDVKKSFKETAVASDMETFAV
jgi:ribonuclease Z